MQHGESEMTDINDWPGYPDADPDCECCLGDGLQADGETPCPCIDARNEPLAAQAASLTPDDLIDLIGEFGREVYHLLDDCETSGPVGEEIHTITEDGLRKVSAILDRIDDLPFEEPGVILGTGAMLQAAIMQTFAHPPQPSEAVEEAAQALGSMPEGYCFCSTDRIGDDSKAHEPECADLRAALATRQMFLAEYAVLKGK